MRKLKLEELNRLSVEAFKKVVKFPIVVILDNIRSGHNTGSIFRTADAFAIEELVLCGITPRPPHREILKSAIGATQSVSWKYEGSVHSALLNLKSSGFRIYGIEQTDSSTSLRQTRWNGEKIAVVFGNEVDGISEEILPLLDEALEVPQWGSKHSLNVSVCAGIVLWHLVSQRC